MSVADTLRSVVAPITVQAINAGADALDERPKLLATIAGLEATVAQLTARVRELEGATTATTLWGSSVWTYTGETYATALARTEKAIGPLQVVRHFSSSGPTWPTWTGTRVLHTSFKTLDDTTVRSWVDRAPADRVTYLTYQHEIDKKVDVDKSITLDAFVAGWRRVAAIVRASGKPIKLTLTLTGWILWPEKNGGRGSWRRFYDPIADVVDVIAWDPYADKDPTGSFILQSYDRCASAAGEVGKPWAVAETGASTEFLTVTQRATVLTAMARKLAALRPLYVCYFDSPTGNNSTLWPITKDATASAAWKAGRG